MDQHRCQRFQMLFLPLCFFLLAFPNVGQSNNTTAKHCRDTTAPSTVCLPTKPGCDLCKDKPDVCKVEISTEWTDEGCSWASTLHNPSSLIMAHEGRSYCVFGEHVMKTNLKNLETLQKFSKLFQSPENPLFNVGSYTIPGNHTLNRFEEEVVPYTVHNDSSVSIPGAPSTTAMDKFNNRGYKYRPIFEPAEQPWLGCKNPYLIEVTQVSVRGRLLHNHLHLRIYSTGDFGVGQNCANGKIKYAMIEVRDSKGFPVGDFDVQLPCGGRECKLTKDSSCEIYEGNLYSDSMPCMFSPHRSVQHPGLILVSFEGLIPPEDKADTESDDGYDEIHVTWRFSQHTSNFLEELHFAALIVDNVEELEYYSGRLAEWKGIKGCKTKSTCKCLKCDGSEEGSKDWEHENESPYRWVINPLRKYFKSKFKRPYGWTARYNHLNLSVETIGSYDYFPNDYFNDPKDINCFVPLESQLYHSAEGFESVLPVWGDALIFPNSFETTTTTTPASSRKRRKRDLSIENDPMYKEETDLNEFQTVYTVDGNDPEKNPQAFLGSQHTMGLNNTLNARSQMSFIPDVDQHYSLAVTTYLMSLPSIQELAANDLCRCAVRFDKAPSVNQLQGRRSHATQMMIAWIIFIPVAIFLARHYKESYSGVKFFQYDWWLTVHVIVCVTALLFMLGGIYVVELKRDSDIPWTVAMKTHVICGSIAMILFTLQLMLGPFWIKSPAFRILQIMLHWFIGMSQFILCVVTIFTAGFIRWSYMSCTAIYAYFAYLICLFLFNLVMEIFMIFKVDKALKLSPRRIYLPAPIRRLFETNRSAPWAKCRIFVLLGYGILNLFFFVLMMIIVHIGGRNSCWERWDRSKSAITRWGDVFYDD